MSIIQAPLLNKIPPLQYIDSKYDPFALTEISGLKFRKKLYKNFVLFVGSCRTLLDN